MFKTGEVPLNSDTKEKMEKIVRLKEYMMKYSEKHCRKLWMGEVDFSLTLKSLGKTWELWKVVRKAKKGKKINRARIKIKEILLGLRKPISITT